MELVQAVVLGIVQGLTEWLPISSTAHLRLVPALLGWSDPGAAFTAAIQLGTMFAVLIYFGRDLIDILTGWVKGLSTSSHRDTSSYRLGWGIFCGTLPILVLGVLLKERIETDFRSITVIAYSLIFMGLVLFAADHWGKRVRSLASAKLSDGVLIGIFQALALIPGVSRSGSTLTGGLLLGFDRPSAARFAFVLSVPSVLAAGVYSLYSHRHELLGQGLSALLVANLFSFVVGYATIAFFMKFLSKYSTTVFVAYRVIIGVAVLFLVSAGRLSPNQVESPTVQTVAVR